MTDCSYCEPETKKEKILLILICIGIVLLFVGVIAFGIVSLVSIINGGFEWYNVLGVILAGLLFVWAWYELLFSKYSA